MSFFTHRPDHEVAVERPDPREHQHQLLAEALSDLDKGWDRCAVVHMAQALYVRAKDENDLLGVSLAKDVIRATGPAGLRP